MAGEGYLHIRVHPEQVGKGDRKHKRIYVSVNAAAFIMNQIERRFAGLEDLLLAYDRLKRSEEDGPTQTKDRQVALDMGYERGNDLVSAAWDVVDWIDRLRKVLGAVAGVKRKEDWYRETMKAVGCAKQMRDFFQHYDRSLTTFVDGGYPLMGSVVCSFPADNGGAYRRVVMATPVRYAGDPGVCVGGIAKTAHASGKVSSIILSIADRFIDLSDVTSTLREGQRHFAAYLADRYQFEWPE